MREIIVAITDEDRAKLTGCKFVSNVVRCKDCKYWTIVDGFKVCSFVEGVQFIRYEDDFCSCGENK